MSTPAAFCHISHPKLCPKNRRPLVIPLSKDRTFLAWGQSHGIDKVVGQISSAGTGTGTISSTNTTVTGAGTTFTTQVKVGRQIGNATSGFFKVTAIASDTSLTIDSTPGTPFSNSAYVIKSRDNGTTVRQPNGDVLAKDKWLKGAARPSGIWAILFTVPPAGTTCQVWVQEDPQDTVHYVGDRSPPFTVGPGRDDLTITSPNPDGGMPSDVCPNFFASGGLATGATVVTATLSVMPGNTAQGGLPVESRTSDSGGSIIGNLWWVEFNVSAGSNRQLDAVADAGNPAPTQNPINNANGAC
jgi:hypothetical protein